MTTLCWGTLWRRRESHSHQKAGKQLIMALTALYQSGRGAVFSFCRCTFRFFVVK